MKAGSGLCVDTRRERWKRNWNLHYFLKDSRFVRTFYRFCINIHLLVHLHRKVFNFSSVSKHFLYCYVISLMAPWSWTRTQFHHSATMHFSSFLYLEVEATALAASFLLANVWVASDSQCTHSSTYLVQPSRPKHGFFQSRLFTNPVTARQRASSAYSFFCRRKSFLLHSPPTDRSRKREKLFWQSVSLHVQTWLRIPFFILPVHVVFSP